MVEVTIEITQYCPYECPECSSNASSEGKHLPVDVIEDFLENQQNITRINISGGEPLAHPQFLNIVCYCYSICSDVRVYTNALKHIVFNSRVIHGIKVEANADIVPGLSTYIPTREEASTVHLLKFIPQGRGKNIPSQDVVVSRNFYDPSHCEECNHILLQADGKIVVAPCKKEYDSK